jgi:4-amino-4-deoxychorismate lyase
VVLIDGESASPDWASDRGLSYGDGLFETVALRHGELLRLDAHLLRLQRGCTALGFLCPDRELIINDCGRLTREHECGVLKIIVTRGNGGRGYRPPAAPKPRRIIALNPWPAFSEPIDGVRTWVCTHRLSSNRVTAGLKHLNRLDQVLASQEWPNENFFEGLMLDADNQLVEGIRSNVFIVINGSVHTPLLDQCGVQGIIRSEVVRWCVMHGVELVERKIGLSELSRADEIFLTNSLIGVRSVTTVTGASVALDPGPLAGRIARMLRQDGAIP